MLFTKVYLDFMLSLISENLKFFILYFVSQSGFIHNFSIYIFIDTYHFTFVTIQVLCEIYK